MVCFSKPLLIYQDSDNFSRFNFNRFFLYQNQKNLEDFVESEPVESEPVNLEFSYSPSIKSLILKLGLINSAMVGSFGIIYGICRLLEYYNIIEKHIK